MVILDTDLFSEYIRKSEAGLRVEKRLEESGEPVILTVVTLFEALHGRTLYCSKSQDIEDFQIGLVKLHSTFQDLQSVGIVSFDNAAKLEYQRLKALKIRIGTNDLRIAAVVLARGAKLYSRNLRDFKRVPGLLVEDAGRP